MKKWCIIDRVGIDEFLTAYESKEEALESAEMEWSELLEHDKKRRDSFLVGLCNVEEYKSGCYQYAELDNGEIDGDVYEVVKTYK